MQYKSLGHSGDSAVYLHCLRENLMTPDYITGIMDEGVRELQQHYHTACRHWVLLQLGINVRHHLV
jgi:hypothetical protein